MRATWAIGYTANTSPNTTNGTSAMIEKMRGVRLDLPRRGDLWSPTSMAASVLACVVTFQPRRRIVYPTLGSDS